MALGVSTFHRVASARIVQRRGERRSLLKAILIASVLVSVYSSIALPFPGRPIPDGVAFLGAMAMFVVSRYRVSRRDIKWFLLVYLVVGISAIFGAGGEALLEQKALSALNFCASLFVGYVVFLEFRRWNQSAMANFLAVLALVLLVGAAAETMLPFVKSLSDMVREYVAFGQNRYEADMRDLRLTGIIRPKFFSLEPSYLSKTYATLVVLWATTAPPRSRTWVVFCILIVGGLFVMRSPSIFAMVPAGVFSIVFMPQKRSAHSSRRGAFSKIASFIAMTVGSLLFLLIGSNVMSGRLYYYLSGVDTSSTIRIWLSQTVASEVIRRYPYFGIGLGGKHAIVDIVLWANSTLAIDAHYSSVDDLANDAFHNTLLEFVATFGIVGSILAGYALFKLYRTGFGTGQVFLGIFVVGISLTGPYVGGSYFWVTVGLAGAAAFSKRVRRDGTPAAVPPSVLRRSRPSGRGLAQKHD